MPIKLILLLFIAHLLADFTFQSQTMADEKSKKAFTPYHLYHVFIVGILSYFASLNLNFGLAVLAIMILHLITDIGKSALQLKYPSKNLFFIDQAIHLTIIVAVAYAYAYSIGVDFLFDLSLKTVATIAGFILITKPTNIIIGNLFKVFKIQISDSNDESLPNAGKLIGIVERLLVLALILIGEFAAVGLILAAKSILRFNGTQKSEYVLVGTLLSFGSAVLTGILITQFIIY